MKKQIKEFDLERLKGKKVAVNCKTEEQAQDFVNWVNSLGRETHPYPSWYIYGQLSCYILEKNLIWGRASKENYQKSGYEIISYEEALLKEPKKQVKLTSNPKKKPTIRKEFIKKVQTEKIGVICTTLEELEIWYDFLDKHMDKNLRRPPKEWIIVEDKLNSVFSNNTIYNNILEWNPNNGFFEKEGFTIYNFKDIIYQQGGILKPKEELCELENYLVYVKGKGQPRVRHTYENAIKEAKRLSAKEIGKEVNVVKVLNTFKSEVIVNEIEGE